jgi:transcriptional regulator with XRE-family HTH domain
MKQQSKDKLAALVRTLRGSTSQRAFSKSLGVSFASVQSWESGDSMPSTENLSAIASVAGYTLQGLIEYLDDKPAATNLPIEQILHEIRNMPPKQLAKVGHAVADRLGAIAESN